VPTGVLEPLDYPITVQATGGGITRSVALTLKVTGIDLTVSPSTQNLNLGGSAQYTLTVTPRNGHTGTALLEVTGLPGNIDSVITPSSLNLAGQTPQQATLTLTAPFEEDGKRKPAADRRSTAAAHQFAVTATSGTATARDVASYTLITTGGIDAVIR
jgi:hypothetical protein